MNCQSIVRNGKTFWFYPDVTMDEQTKGFLIATDDMLLPMITEAWRLFAVLTNDTDRLFSVYVGNLITDERVRTATFERYLALPTTLLCVVGRAIPRHSTIIKKRRVSSISAT